jgi:hypothetical protein
MDEATKSIFESYNVSPETKKELVKDAIEKKQQELLQLGNQKALNKNVVEQAAAQAAITAPNKTAAESIIEATSELTEELSFLGLETEEPPYTKTEPLEESGNPAFVESEVLSQPEEDGLHVNNILKAH